MFGNQYSTGVQQGLARAQLVQQAIRQAQAMRQAQAELEMRARQFQAQQEAREKEALRREQELAVESAYKETMLGLRERQLENQARSEERRINDAANRTAAMLKIQQQNADTARMRATQSTKGFTKVDLSPGHYMTAGGGHFYARGGNELTDAGENALRSGLQSAQAVIRDSNSSEAEKAVARARVKSIMQQLGEEMVTEEIPGSGSPEVKRWGPLRNTPAVPPTMTNYVRRISQPIIPQQTNSAPAIPTATSSPVTNALRILNIREKAYGKMDEPEITEEDDESEEVLAGE